MKAHSPIERISAITLAVRDMTRAVAFYEKLGFRLFYGGADFGFSSLRAGEAIVNLAASSAYDQAWWGRIVFRVADVDAQYRALVTNKLKVQAPKNAHWGERYFHVRDPDGHELSFAEVLAGSSADL